MPNLNTNGWVVMYALLAMLAGICVWVFDPYGPNEAEIAAWREERVAEARRRLQCNLVGDYYECRPLTSIHYKVAECDLKVMGLRPTNSYDLERYRANHFYPGDVYALGTSERDDHGNYTVAALRGGESMQLIVEDHDGCDFLLDRGVIILAKR